jgi:hypothetical protein
MDFQMATKSCSVDGCDRPFYGVGYCEKHYRRVRKTGSSDSAKGHHLPLSEKFFMNVIKSDGCWTWSGPTYKGYGRVWVDGKNMRAHRASWLLANGDIPAGLLVLHKCDNASCVNPAHLYVGTHQDNMRDKVERDRCAHSDRKGEKGGRTVLTADDVLRIRADSRMNKDLATEYGVDSSTISDIKRRKSWTHI